MRALLQRRTERFAGGAVLLPSDLGFPVNEWQVRAHHLLSDSLGKLRWLKERGPEGYALRAS